MRIEWGQDLFGVEMCPKEGTKSDSEPSDDQMLHSTPLWHGLPAELTISIHCLSCVSSSILQTWKNKWVVELFDHIHQGETKTPFQVFVEQESEISN